LGRKKTNLIGDAFLSCGAVSYYGPFTGEYRNMLVADWVQNSLELGVPCSGNAYSLAKTLGDPVEIREWQNNALPTDSVSTNNGVLVTRGKRWPLMIDPQGQANKWIKKMDERANLQVTVMSDPNLLRTLENCIRVGWPLLIEDVGEYLEPALEPVLQRATFKQGNRVLIRLGDSDIDYDPNFKLYMTSKNPNPHYLPEVCIKVTLINFTVTLSGLEDQLLGMVVRKERPDIEDRKVRLVLRMAEDKKQLQDLEARILKLLSESKGNILDDEVLINTLDDSKSTSKVINERVQEAEKTEIEINEARMRYVPASTRGALIYFVIADMGSVDPMYQYSLAYFQALFDKCLEQSEKSDDLDKRIGTIVNYSTYTVYANICRGLFKQHKILFSALLCFSILRNAGRICDSEWNLFVRGAGVVDRSIMPDNPKPDVISEQGWDLIFAAETRIEVKEPKPAGAGEDEPAGAGEGEEGDAAAEDEAPGVYVFQGICKSISSNWDAWEAWSSSADPLSAELPDGFSEKINMFQRLILLKVFRDDILQQGVQRYVGYGLEKRFSEAPVTSMEEVFSDLNKTTPCIFILSKGADPTNMVLRFAGERGYADRIHLVSLGQGQGPVAEQLVERGCQSGDWVLLQNCMLAKSWMPAMEKMIMELPAKAAQIHNDFRLFLTSSPASYFPVAVLQNGVKMTNEPPNGIKANVLKSFASLVKEEYFESSKKGDEFKKLLIAIALFHANIQERRKFGPLGWNIQYAFDESDLETSFAVMHRFLEQQDEIPWGALLFITGQINYGGRVTDDWDRRCLMSILGKFVTPKALEPGYNFSNSGIYHIPSVDTMADVINYFEALPGIDDPEVFGMHENANTTFNRQESLKLMKSVLDLQPRTGGGGGGKSSDEIVIDLATGFQEQTPQLLDDEDAGPTTFIVQENGLLTSLMIVLKQEMVKFNRLIRRMVSTLVDLKKAIKGEIVMSLDLDRMYTAFMSNAVPGIWSSVSFASLKTLGSWVKDLIFRVEFMCNWLKNGQPVAFPMPVFFFPQGFMTGTLQTYARKYQVAIDTLNFKYDVLETPAEDITEAPDDGVFVYGLWMEGARWDAEAKKMAISRPGEMYTPIPTVHFQPEVDHKVAADVYQLPVYKTDVRKGVLSTTGMSTNFVVPVELPTDVPPETWVLYGCAGLCNLSD